MRELGLGNAVWLQSHQNRLHGVLLCIGDKPFNLVAEFLHILDEIILLAEYNLLWFPVSEEFRRGRAQALDDVQQRAHGGRGQVTFQLGDKAFG